VYSSNLHDLGRDHFYCQREVFTSVVSDYIDKEDMRF
jgi:hypothetical protein